MTPFELATIVLAVVSGIFGTIGWLLVRLLNHQRQLTADKDFHRKELLAEKDKTAESKFEQLIQQMNDLVEQIRHLFRDQEIVTQSISNLGERVGNVEKRLGQSDTRCNEREKHILDKFKVIHNRIDDNEKGQRDGKD